MILVKTPIGTDNFYNTVLNLTVRLDMNELLVNIFNTFIMDKISFITNGEIDESLYIDIFETIKEHTISGTDINEYARIRVTLTDILNVMCLNFLKSLKDKNLLSIHSLYVKNVTQQYIMVVT